MIPWGQLITGAVGLAGISGTLWQGKRAREAASKDLRESMAANSRDLLISINAEDRRAHLVEKRRVYASCQTAISEMIVATVNCGSVSRSDDREGLELAQEREDRAIAQMYAVESELRLIAPANIRSLVKGVIGELLDYITASLSDVSPDDNSEQLRLREEMQRAMRADLGEPSK